MAKTTTAAASRIAATAPAAPAPAVAPAPTPAVTERINSAPRTFAFKPIKGVPIPTIATVPPRAAPHAFAEFFDTAEHGDMIFIPLAYFTAPKEEGGRGITLKENVKPAGYMKNTVRGVFNAWKTKTETVTKGKDAEGKEVEVRTNPREDFDILTAYRTAGEVLPGDETAEEDGLAVWFVKKASA